jgi:polyketide cyclase/dehydrase/lipid transport protein
LVNCGAMFDFQKSITINKTPHEVFEFVANPYNARHWRHDVLETKTKSLPLQVDDTFEEIIDFNGHVTSTVRVVAIIPDQRMVLKVMSGGLYLPKREMTVEEEGAHTKFSIKVSALSDGFTRLIEPISLNAYSIKWENYLFTLKRVLESHRAEA